MLNCYNSIETAEILFFYRKGSDLGNRKHNVTLSIVGWN